MNINVKDIIADSHLAFLNQENETALRLARQAISWRRTILTHTDAPETLACHWTVMMRPLSITGQLSNMILTTATGIMTLDLR